MSEKSYQEGSVLTLTAPATVTSGNAYKIGSMIVIALTSVASGESFAAAVDGVHEVVKNSGETWSEGSKVYWDNTNSEFTTTSTSNTAAGYAVAAAGSSAVVGYIKLCQIG